MVGDVELGVVHPDRRKLAEQRQSDELSQLRHQMQPALHMGPHRVEPEASAGVVQWAALEDPDGAHVHRCVWRFHVEERRIKLRQKVDWGCHVDRGGPGGRAAQTSENPSSMQPASFALSSTAAMSVVMVTQARSAVETSDTLRAAPDGGVTA